MRSTLVLGLGDVRRGDDAFGPQVLRELQQAYALDPQILTVEAAGVGMRTLPLLSSVGQVLLVTAVRVGGSDLQRAISRSYFSCLRSMASRCPRSLPQRAS